MLGRFITLLLTIGVIGQLFLSLPVQAQSADSLRFSAHRLPIDLSFLNEKPAGLRGPVRAKGADLVFADGTPVRFWGANVQAQALLHTDPQRICEHAKRIGALGFNLVRLHHHDSHWVKPNIFGDKPRNTRLLDRGALDRIGLWVACLKVEGIYTWLDIQVGRRMSAADDIDFADEVERRRGDIRGFNFVNDSIRDRMAEFQETYLSYVNPHTGLAFKEDPAVAFVLISNENDATYHFANKLLPDKNVPKHTELYFALAKEFAETHGFNERAVKRSWEHGPSKIFLNDLERRFFTPLQDDIRKMGFKGLIATSSIWGNMGLAALPSLTVGDVIDVHAYGDVGLAETKTDTQEDMISVIAGAQVAGMPLTISEWNITPWPEPDRFVAPLRMGAAAAHQGWDAPIIYGYAQNNLRNELAARNWHIAQDVSMLGALSVAALLYRRGDVSPARHTVALAPDADAFFNEFRRASTSSAIRSYAERSRLVTVLPDVEALPWLQPTTEPLDETLSGYGAIFPGAAKNLIVSDTEEIRRDPERGIFSIETDRSLVIAGQLGQAPHQIGALRVALDQPLAGVALQSLDGKPIAQSQDLLVTIMGPSTPAKRRSGPFFVERATGEIAFSANPNLAAQGSAIGVGRGTVSHTVTGDTHRLTFNKAASVGWIRLRIP